MAEVWLRANAAAMLRRCGCGAVVRQRSCGYAVQRCNGAAAMRQCGGGAAAEKLRRCYEGAVMLWQCGAAQRDSPVAMPQSGGGAAVLQRSDCDAVLLYNGDAVVLRCCGSDLAAMLLQRCCCHAKAMRQSISQ